MRHLLALLILLAACTDRTSEEQAAFEAKQAQIQRQIDSVKRDVQHFEDSMEYLHREDSIRRGLPVSY